MGILGCEREESLLKCPHCEKLGLASTLRQNGPAEVGRDLGKLEYLTDENGKEHSHNSNSTTTSYVCSEGHAFTVKQWPTCWCGWTKEKESIVL